MSTQITVNLVKIPVSDIDKALPFYRDVLGLSEDFVAAEYGWAQLSSGNLPVALYVPGMGGGAGEAGAADGVHFAISDAGPLRERLTQAGLNPDDHSHQGNDGSTFFELHDPDGNTFKVMVC